MADASAEHLLVGTAHRAVVIPVGAVRLAGDLDVPAAVRGGVIFAHGSGSSRLSPRNRQVAHRLNQAGLLTLLFDLLTPAEADDRANVFDIGLLAGRLAAASGWLQCQADARAVRIGYFGASTGAAALVAAAGLGAAIGATVSRGGRPDVVRRSVPAHRLAGLLGICPGGPLSARARAVVSGLRTVLARDLTTCWTCPAEG
jgi:hypothetical protein